MLDNEQSPPGPSKGREETNPNIKSGNGQRGIKALYAKTRPLIKFNLAWFVLSLPVVTIFPALGGLYHAILSFNQETPVEGQTVREGFRKFWQLSIQWGLVVLLGDLLLAGGIWLALDIEAEWGSYALVVGVVFAILWVAINQFSFPLLLLQQEKKVLTAIRNGYVIVVRRPWMALKALGLSLLISLISILIPPLWILISMALITQIQTRTVLNVVEKIRREDSERDSTTTDHNEQDEGNQENEEE